MREHRPQLPRVFVGDRHQQLAEGHPARELRDPDLLGRGFFHADCFGALQAAAGPLDQQRAQVRITAVTQKGSGSFPGVVDVMLSEPQTPRSANANSLLPQTDAGSDRNEAWVVARETGQRRFSRA